jgi:hypothetical protein
MNTIFLGLVLNKEKVAWFWVEFASKDAKEKDFSKLDTCEKVGQSCMIKLIQKIHCFLGLK